MASEHTQERASSNAVLEATNNQPTLQLTYPVASCSVGGGGTSLRPLPLKHSGRLEATGWGVVAKTQRDVCGRLLGGGVPGARGKEFIKLPLKFICSFDVLTNEELSCCFGGGK